MFFRSLTHAHYKNVIKTRPCLKAVILSLGPQMSNDDVTFTENRY